MSQHRRMLVATTQQAKGATLNKLRETREAQKLRLQDLCWIIRQATGERVSEATLSRLERGHVDSNYRTRALIARALRLPPADLWGDD